MKIRPIRNIFNKTLLSDNYLIMMMLTPNRIMAPNVLLFPYLNRSIDSRYYIDLPHSIINYHMAEEYRNKNVIFFPCYNKR